MGTSKPAWPSRRTRRKASNSLATTAVPAAMASTGVIGLPMPMVRIENRFGDVVDDADSVVAQAGGSYRAQFKGLTENDAKNACRTLVAKRQVCMVMKP